MSQCNKPECGRNDEMIPEGEEVGVFVFRFDCDCGAHYTVKCRREDTAKCYECRERGRDQDNIPGNIIPRQFIKKRTDRVHSCSRCRGNGNCPNFSR